MTGLPDPGTMTVARTALDAAPKKADTVHPATSRPTPPRAGLGWLVVALSVLGGAEARAGATDVSPAWSAASHRQYCKCAERCRGPACCCGRGSTAEARPIGAEAPAKGPDGSAPCLAEAPCRPGEGLPSSSPPSPISKSVAVLSEPARPMPWCGARVEAAAPLPPEDPPSSRLVEPPEDLRRG